jgi:hypothetical protein
MSGEQHASDHARPGTPLTPPPPPEPGELGGMGPCGSMVTEAKNDAWPNQKVWVIEPTGDCAPRAGGRGDDDRRPVVLVAGGWSVFEETSPAAYYGLCENLVSNGYIVVFANYNGDADAFLDSSDLTVYHQVDAAFVQAATMSDRMDLGDVGIWGHSFGAAMVPWLGRQAASRGWGSETLWLGSYSPYYPRGVGEDPEPIEVPAHTRALVLAYESDVFAQYVDAAAPQIFHRLAVPASQKRHVIVTSDERGGDDDKLSFVTNHFTPAGWPAMSHLNYYGTHRNVQAIAECARARTECDVDLTYMGTWSDGTPASPAIVSEDP